MARPVSDHRRPEIIEGLKKTLSLRGLSLPSNDEISKQAGMSRQLLRHYYPDQAQIALDLAKHLGDTYKDLLAKGVAAVGKINRLEFYLDFYFGLSQIDGVRKPEDDEVYDALFSLATADMTMRDELNRQYSVLVSVFAHELQLAEPNLSVPLCEELGMTIVSLMYGHWKMAASLDVTAADNKVAREAVDRLIYSYVADPPVRNKLPDGAQALPPHR